MVRFRSRRGIGAGPDRFGRLGMRRSPAIRRQLRQERLPPIESLNPASGLNHFGFSLFLLSAPPFPILADRLGDLGAGNHKRVTGDEK